MSAAVFVDTNVLVYSRDARVPLKQAVATDWLRELWTEHRGRTSTQVLSEYYVTVTRKLVPSLSVDKAWEDVLALLNWEPQEITRDLLLRAKEIEQRYSVSWWDAMIVAAAELQNCSLLLTEDLQDRMVYGSVTVRNPFATRVAEEPAEYAPADVAVSRHRSRGRPRAAIR
jgi:predicted nucleic acid-binding protein